VLTENFSLDRISKNPAVFDEKKLEWINAAHIKEMGAVEFIDSLLPYLCKAGLTRAGNTLYDSDGLLVSGQKAAPELVEGDVAANRAWYEAIYPLVAERARTIAEVVPMISYLFSGDDVYRDETSVSKCLKTEGAVAILQAVLTTLNDPELAWETASIEEALRKIPEQLELKPKVVFQAVRVAVCGNVVSPPLFESIELLGATNVSARLNKAIDLAK
jgi:glutamyl-tRNA synthetase